MRGPGAAARGFAAAAGAALALAATAPSGPGALMARAGDAAPVTSLSPLWLDHAVSSADHVVSGTYRAGSLEVAAELKGKLASPRVALTRDEVEVPRSARAPGTDSPEGEGVFFLLERFEPRESAGEGRRLIAWAGPEGVAWIRTGSVFALRSGADDRFSLVPLGPRALFLEGVAASLSREAALKHAVALPPGEERARALALVVAGARSGPPEVEADLGHDPFAERALAELPASGPAALAALREVRAKAGPSWVKAGAVRALASVPGEEAVRLLEHAALDAASGEDEVVAAVAGLFHVDGHLDVLARLVHDPRARVRREVAATLREKVSDLDLLLRLARDADPSVRSQALESARAAARRLGLADPDPDAPTRKDPPRDR